MTDSEQLAFILKVLRIFEDEDAYGDLFWRTGGEWGDVSFAVICNDLFWWATADAEGITPENLPLLEQAIAECKGASEKGHSNYFTALFACKSRKMRPQGAAYPKDPRVWPLFDACGPERNPDLEPFGNPKPHP